MLFIKQSQNLITFFKQERKTKITILTQKSLNKGSILIYILTLLENIIHISFGRQYNKFALK